MKEEKINIKGLNICYKIFGEEKTSLPADRRVLLLHGWGSKSDNWRKVGEILAENGLNPVRKNQESNDKTFYPNHSKKVGLSNGVKVIIPDLPGFGKSAEPPKAWNLDDYCDFIEEFINALNLERFYLLGHSFGGALAVKCSLKFPEKIDKLFLVSASCIRTRDLKKKILYIISKIFKVFSFIPFLRKLFYRFVVGKSDYLSVEGVMRDTYLKIIAEDLSGILSQVKVLTVIIWGKEDDITPVKDAHLIKEKIKDSELEIIPNVNHDLNLKAPEKLAEAIIKFL